MKKQAFLIATHLLTEDIIKLYSDIARASREYGETFLLYHQRNNIIPEELPEIKVYTFTDDILHELGYVPLIERIVPGSNHFPLFQFFIENPQFDFYWNIEYDVIFNGDWKYFFKTLNKLSDDFISSYIELYKDNPDWPWWETLYHPAKEIVIKNRIRSFNPLYRISNAAMVFMHKLLLDGWAGHHEVLLPTLLYQNDFTLLDFGGDGNFVPIDLRNKFYTPSTFRWQPTFRTPVEQKDKLYHPVK